MKKPMLVAAVLALVTIATPAFADGHRDRDNRNDRHEHRHSDRRDDRHDVRHERRDDRYDRRYSSRDDRRYVRYAPRYAPRYVVNGRYCDDRRHYRDVHYHVASRDYYSYGYPRDAYEVRRGGGLDATLIVTLPLF